MSSATLQTYTLPEFYAQAPDSWEQRLREISPILPNLSHLRFRKFEPVLDPGLAKAAGVDPRGDWYWPERPIWALYRATPKPLVEKDVAELHGKHWSEYADEGERVAVRSIVSDYQHFMWHTHGLRVTPFWLLQGEWGGTPMKYTKREKAYLKGVGAVDEPFPIGWFPACPFDERAVQKILMRDRLIQAGNRFDDLEKQSRPDWQKAEDDAAELHYRETVLASLREINAPAIEFMKTQKFAREAEDYLPPAPKGLANTLATWKDVFKETGRMPMVGSAPMKKVFATS